MKNKITNQLRALRQVSYIAVAAVLLVAILPLVSSGDAIAGKQLAYRSIQMSDSSPSNGTYTAAVGSGLNVTYKVSFTAFTNASSIVIDFCQNDPIISDTCSAPAGMGVTSATIDATTADGVDTNVTAAGWQVDNTVTADASTGVPAGTASNPRIGLKQASGTALSGSAAGVAHTFALKGITNPSVINTATQGTFYARIYTYANSSFGSYTNAAAVSTSGYQDYGGIALSVDSVINIQARVQETLTFCVSQADPNTWTHNDPGACDDTAVNDPTTGLPNLILGHGSPTKVLDSQNVDYANVWTQLSTNATNGAVINMHSNIPCGGLSADYVAGSPTATCAIPAINGGANTGPIAMPFGTAAFGVAINTYAPSAAGLPATIGSVAPTTPYYSSGGPSNDGFTGNVPSATTLYGMDNTTAISPSANANQTSYNGAVTSIYGSTVGVTNAPVYRAYDRYTFAATAALTTPAGIYTSNLSLIATGTF